jgi:CHAT domain-containing protein
MRKKLYPASRYPDGHRDLAQSLNNLGFLLQARGEYGQARPYCEQALAMQQSLANRLVESSALAEAAQYIQTLPLYRDFLLSMTAQTKSADTALYTRLWAGRSATTRLLERRHQSLQAVADRPEVRSRREALTEVSRQLTRLLLNPPQKAKDLDDQVRALTGRKERLERELAPLLPALAAQKELDALGPKALQGSLPERTAFADLLRYTYFEQDPKVPGEKGQKRTPRYVAFVLTRDLVQRVELGDAASIEPALEKWRRAIDERRNDAAATELRRRVWEPIARHLPAGTDTVYLAPDGALTRLPWAALPGDPPGTVLLERYTFAVVPHGRFLLARLREKPRPGADLLGTAGLLLAVGGVRYDDTPAPRTQPPATDLVAALPRDRGTAEKWPFLPATAREVKSLASFPGLQVRAVSGAEASTARLFRELPQARIAHLATHGFFAQDAFDEEQRRAARQLEHWQFQPAQATQPIGLGARNPLSFAGLVLAGANRPQQAGPDGGILTGEALIHLPLERLQLAVLSACQTGLGSVADGQCVHSLQLAFHVAGCPNVVASLWNVPDQPTAALMAVFYDELLRQKRPPLEALRQAQLTVYRHPQQVAELAERGAVRLQQANAVGPSGSARAAVKDWAAFVLSGHEK